MPVAEEHAAGGPFYFALVDSDETTFTSEHHRYDEYVFAFERILKEGAIPTLSVTMKNPGALLAPGRKLWAWLAWNDGSTVRPLFFGRIVGIPSDLQAETIVVQFVARPLDFVSRKATAASALKVLPFYDPVCVDPNFRDDPDTVLEGYSSLWCHDPVTHAVTAEDLIVGSAGTKTFAAGEVFYDSLKTTISGQPKRAVTLNGTVGWTQQDANSFAVDTPVLTTYDGGQSVDAWPKPGTSIGQGWTVDQATAGDAYAVADVPNAEGSFHFEDKSPRHNNGDTINFDVRWSRPIFKGNAFPVDVTSTSQVRVGDPDSGQAGSINVNISTTWAAVSKIATSLSVRYEAKRDRSETLTITMQADLQPVLVEDDEPVEPEVINVSGADVGSPIDTVIPIGEVSRRAYFPTARGRQTVEHYLCRMRARLVSTARPFGATFDTPFATTEPLRLTQNGYMSHRRLPGGEAIGKITETHLRADGSSGVMSGSVTLACAVGTDAAFADADGTPTCTDADCLGPDCQVFEGRIVALGTGDVGYTPPVESDDSDDGLRFPLTAASAIVANGLTITADPGTSFLTPRPSGSIGTISGQINAFVRQQSQWDIDAEHTKQRYELELKPVTNGPFADEYDVTCTVLSLPKQVDLQAS